jgi:hypothetical protein
MLAIITVLPLAAIGIGAAVVDPNDYKRRCCMNDF